MLKLKNAKILLSLVENNQKLSEKLEVTNLFHLYFLLLAFHKAKNAIDFVLNGWNKYA